MTRTGRGPTLPYASRVVPSAWTAQASVTDARSWPRRRVRRTWTAPGGLAGRGSSMAVTSSPRASVVTPERTKNSSIGIRRVPSGTGHDHGRVVDEQRRRGIGRRRGVADVAGQRRPVPDLDRADDGGRLGQGREFAPDPRVGRDVGHHRPRPDRQPAVALADLAVQLGDPLEVDDDSRLDRPVAQPDDQVGPAGEQPRLGAALAEQGDGVAERGRSLVREGSHRRA